MKWAKSEILSPRPKKQYPYFLGDFTRLYKPISPCVLAIPPNSSRATPPQRRIRPCCRSGRQKSRRNPVFIGINIPTNPMPPDELPLSRPTRRSRSCSATVRAPSGKVSFPSDCFQLRPRPLPPVFPFPNPAQHSPCSLIHILSPPPLPLSPRQRHDSAHERAPFTGR